MIKPSIKVAVIGAGSRGSGFGEIIRDAGCLASVVGVAEPKENYRRAFTERHELPDSQVFASWEEMIERPKFCDAVIISTPDTEHVRPAVAFLERGYHVLLEKPMAPTLADCRAIEAAQRKAGTMVAICHSLRYQKGFAKVKEIADSGLIGKIVTLDQIEQVGFWHQAHSYVRGNWSNEARSTFMLMAKSCHDIDYIGHLVGKPCRSVNSYGSLSFFRVENAPSGAPPRCTDGCPVEQDCPYSAIKVYVNSRREAWPAAVCSFDHSQEAHLEAIRTGPYGRCVFHCDNDVVDHQVVSMEFENNVTATFTMTAFAQLSGRSLRVNGTKGELHFHDKKDAISLRTFADNNATEIALGAEPGVHGGGDVRVVSCWLQAISRGDESLIATNASQSLESHTVVFAAEKSRIENRRVGIAEMHGIA